MRNGARLLIVFAALGWNSARRMSATWDEPGHIAAGYAALTRGDYRLDIEHPPLARMWSALPLVALRPVLNVETRVVDDEMRDVKPSSGEIGEVVHRSPHLMLGYFQDEERTKAAWRARPRRLPFAVRSNWATPSCSPTTTRARCSSQRGS